VPVQCGCHDYRQELTANGAALPVSRLVVAGVLTYLIIRSLPFTFKVPGSLHRGAWTAIPLLMLAWLHGANP
jgi:hypothetical protein